VSVGLVTAQVTGGTDVVDITVFFLPADAYLDMLFWSHLFWLHSMMCLVVST
jgi:hypothetical protein